MYCLSLLGAITKYHRLSSLYTINIDFLQFWRLEVWDQCTIMLSETFHWVLTWQKKKETISYSVVPDCLWTRELQPTRLPSPWDFLGKDTEVSCHFLLQWIFPTQGLNLGLLHYKQIVYWLRYEGGSVLAFLIMLFKKFNSIYQISTIMT